MTTLPPLFPPPASIPLTSEVKAAYKALYDTYEVAIENTTDPGLLEVLNASQTNVDNVLTKNAMYVLNANTALFQALTDQIKSTNDELLVLKKQIEQVADRVSMAAQVLGAITTVLNLVPVG